MDITSEEESDFSDSEIHDYAEKPLELLRTGKLIVKHANGVLRCPFCAGKKKQEYKYSELFQHASGVAKGSATRTKKEKVNHLALEKYLEIYIRNESDQPQLPPPPVPATQPPKKDDLYVWPWMGIIVRVVGEPNDLVLLRDSAYWLKTYAKYKPSEVHTFWCEKTHIMTAALEFNGNWNGFMITTDFEKAFETRKCGKKDWKIDKETRPHSSSFYGWCARGDDFNSKEPIGQFLQAKGRLRTIFDIFQEETESRNTVVEKLSNTIDVANENLDEMKYKYNKKTMSLSRMLEEIDQLHHAFVEETRKVQRHGRDKVRMILEDQEKLNYELEINKKKLDSWSKEVNKQEVVTERERQKLDEEKRKNDVRNNHLQLASIEQQKAGENVMRLLEEHKEEKEKALQKILQLEKQLDAQQKLEFEIEELKGKIQVMKHLEDADDEAVKKKMKEMTDELEEKIENLDQMVSLNQTLVVKERQSNVELQEARKYLINSLSGMMGARSYIGIKRMGEINDKPFLNACKQRFPPEEAAVQASILLTLWQEHLTDSNWHPFKIVTVPKEKRVIDEDDEKLKNLRAEWGDEIYNAVTTALMELIEYNASGSYVVSELWNFKEGRKARLKEVSDFLLNRIKTLKRKRK